MWSDWVTQSKYCPAFEKKGSRDSLMGQANTANVNIKKPSRKCNDYLQ